MSVLKKQLISAVQAGDLAAVQAALAAGADAKAEDCRAFRLAASNGHLAIVQYFLTAGVDDPAALGVALLWAAQGGHLAVAKSLLSAGANAKALDGYALNWAARGGNLAAVACMLELGTYAQAGKDHALRWAAEHGQTPIVRLLIAHGARIESRALGASLRLYGRDVQVALLEAGDVSALSGIDIAAQGACPEALCILMNRQGHAALASMLAATQMLEPLTPDDRAEMLRDLLANHPQSGISNVNP